MKGIAIKGSNKYGSLVIRLLETLGGINNGQWGSCEETYYYIDSKTGRIEQQDIYNTTVEDTNWFESHVLFNVLDFANKYPYLTGDKVIYDNSGKQGIIYRSHAQYDKNNKFKNLLYIIDIGGGKLIHDIEEEDICYLKSKENIPKLDIDPHMKLSGEILIDIPSGYEFDRVIVEDNKTSIVCIPVKPKLPTTIEEIKKLLGNISLDIENSDPLSLLIAFRNAWWKVLNFDPKDEKELTVSTITDGYNGYSIRYISTNRVICTPWKFPNTEISKQFYITFEHLFDKL